MSWRWRTVRELLASFVRVQDGLSFGYIIDGYGECTWEGLQLWLDMDDRSLSWTFCQRFEVCKTVFHSRGLRGCC